MRGRGSSALLLAALLLAAACGGGSEEGGGSGDGDGATGGEPTVLTAAPGEPVRIDLEAFEYGFRGVPEAVQAGPAVVTLRNPGVEHHEAVLWRRNAGVSQSFDELLAMPEEQRLPLITFRSAGHSPPGETDVQEVPLEPGDYLLACFFPVGSVGNEIGTGPPHWQEGMRAELTVVG